MDVGTELLPAGGDEENATAFAEHFAGKLAFIHETGKWMAWNGTHWEAVSGKPYMHARRLAKALAVNGGKDATKLWRSRTKMEHMIALAAADSLIQRHLTDFDADPWLLGVPNGVVDLRRGELVAPNASQLVTKRAGCAFDPAAKCPQWEAFIAFAMGGDKAVVRYMRAWFGYCLTGIANEKKLFYGYGAVPDSGKSTVQDIGLALMGEYGRAVEVKVFMSSQWDKHPTEIANMCGARFVTASETEAGRVWNNARLKLLTGNEDAISARYMRGDFFEFKPTFKLNFFGNNKPALLDMGDAEKVRFVLVPFECSPDVLDRELKEKLKAELPGILNWAIRGCLDWQRNGLVIPAAVRAATEQYFMENDAPARWRDECLETGKAHIAPNDALWASWSSWCLGNGEATGSQNRAFPAMMRRLGFEPIKDVAGLVGRGWQGVQVKAD